MKKQLGLLLAGILVAASLTGCSEDPNIPRYAFVSDSGAIDAAGPESAVWDSVRRMAENAGFNSLLCEAADSTETDIDAAFAKAKDEKAHLVIAYGESMEVPLYKAASGSRKGKFVLIDGFPRNAKGTASIGENTFCVHFAREQEGFMLGYASVRNGARNLGVLMGERTETNEKYVTGFVQGVRRAAADLGLENGTVSVNGKYAMTDELTPLRMSDAYEMYESGADTILVSSENIALAVAEAAKLAGKTFVYAGGNLTAQEETCLMGISVDYGGAVRSAVGRYERSVAEGAAEADAFPGGTDQFYGFGESSLQLVVDYSRLASFAPGDYDAIVQRIASGDVTILPDERISGDSLVSVSITEDLRSDKTGDVAADGTIPADPSAETTSDTTSDTTSQAAAEAESISAESTEAP